MEVELDDRSSSQLAVPIYSLFYTLYTGTCSVGPYTDTGNVGNITSWTSI